MCPLENCVICSSPTACSTCDEANFYGIDAVTGTSCAPCNQSCTCSGFSLPYNAAENRCTATCGDGFVAEPMEECDDGNTNPTDGCSSACQIEEGFVCSREDPDNLFTETANPSICSVSGFKVALADWHENEPYFCDNKIVFELQFTPYEERATQILYEQLDYASVVSVNDSILEMETAEYDVDRGIASLTFRYSEDMHGKTIKLTFNTALIPQLQTYDEVSLTATLEDTTGPVITHPASTCDSLKGPFGKIGVIAGAIAMGLLLLLVFFKRKIIALELLLVFQVAFFSLANSNFVPMLLTPLMSFRVLATGYNAQMSQSMGYPPEYLESNRLISYKVESMGYTSETTLNFFANVNVMILVALCIPLVALILRASAFAIEKLGTAALYLMKEFFLTLMIYCAMGFGFMAGLHLNYERKFYLEFTDQHEEDQTVKINYFFGNLTTMAAITLVFSTCVLSELGESEGFGEYRSIFKKDNKGAKIYLTVSIAFRFLMGLITAALSSEANAGIGTLVVATMFWVFVVAITPFKEKLQNARSLAVHGCIVGILAIQVGLNSSAEGGDMGELGRSMVGGIFEWVLIGGIFIFSIVCVVLLLKEKWDKYNEKDKVKDYIYQDKKGKKAADRSSIYPDGSLEEFS